MQNVENEAHFPQQAFGASAPDTSSAAQRDGVLDPFKGKKSVFVAIVGKPNVGKSSLLNRLVGEKVAIVTNKPQTTRNRITGILTVGDIQYVFLDTPGMHIPHTKLGKRMTRTVKDVLSEVDASIMMFEPEGDFLEPEIQLVESMRGSKIPSIGVCNKVDIVKNKGALSNKIQKIIDFDVFKEVRSISAVSGQGCDELLQLLEPYAVAGPHFFAEDAYTDLPEKQLIAEIVREKILQNMQEEIPHGTAVAVERFKERKEAKKPLITDIDVTIYCEKKSHKGMLIGKGGQMLKKIASEARLDAEELLACKVNLQCWVKVRDDWRDSDLQLNNFGFGKQ